MRRLMVLAGSIAVVLVGVSAASSARTTQAATQGRWVIRDLGTLGGKQSGAVAINDQGQIVGWADTKAKSENRYPISHAFLWQNGKMRDLGAFDPSAMNERGQIAGSRWKSGTEHTVLWQGGKMRDLGAPGGKRDRSWAVAINDRGQIAGEWVDTPQDQFRGFVWRNGRMTDLGTFGEATFLAGWSNGISRGEDDELGKAINNRGQIVGSSSTKYVPPWPPSRTHAFLWQNGRMRGLGTLGERYSEALAINDRGQVVFNYEPARKEVRAAVWENGTTRPLPTPRGGDCRAVDINERGQIVGRCWGPGDGLRPHPWLWQDGKGRDLGLVFGQRGRATAVNDRGQVIGWARDATPGEGPGVIHAFVWEKGKMTDLPLLPGAKQSIPVAISNKGWIVGSVTMKTPPLVDRNRAVLWTYKP